MKNFKTEKERLKGNIFIVGLLIGLLIGLFVMFLMFFFNIFGTAENNGLYPNEYSFDKEYIEAYIYSNNKGLCIVEFPSYPKPITKVCESDLEDLE